MDLVRESGTVGFTVIGFESKVLSFSLTSGLESGTVIIRTSHLRRYEQAH